MSHANLDIDCSYHCMRNLKYLSSTFQNYTKALLLSNAIQISSTLQKHGKVIWAGVGGGRLAIRICAPKGGAGRWQTEERIWVPSPTTAYLLEAETSSKFLLPLFHSTRTSLCRRKLRFEQGTFQDALQVKGTETYCDG